MFFIKNKREFKKKTKFSLYLIYYENIQNNFKYFFTNNKF